MLAFDPEKRQTCEELLKHEYVSQLHEESDEPSRGRVRRAMFEFERRAVSNFDLEEELFREMLEYHPDMKEAYVRQSSYDSKAIPLSVDGGESEESEDEDADSRDAVWPLCRIVWASYYSKTERSFGKLTADNLRKICSFLVR